MATNHTSNYQLHLWEPGDSFLREEFNENSEKVDGALGEQAARLAEVKTQVSGIGYTAGFYTGTNGTQTITLGYRPQAVLILEFSGKTGYQNSSSYHVTYGGLAVEGQNSTGITITDDGFQVSNSDSSSRLVYLNSSGGKYRYLAFR